jgi:soluble lytic murein transglycosylase-like protein
MRTRLRRPRHRRTLIRLWRRASNSGLVLAALLGVGLAGERLRQFSAPITPPILAAPPALFPLAPGHRSQTRPLGESNRHNHVSPDELLAAVKARAARGDPRVPGVEVDRWILRLTTDPEMRSWMEDGLSRMGRYAPLIRESLDRNGQPADLLFLVVIESQFRPAAVSPAGATGLWQFMAGTGRMYDLEISTYVDERRDPIRSTEAAVRHLRDLHAEFRSWHLALAAYNAGSGRIDRAVRRHAGGRRGEETLYWQVRPHLPRETQRYVPLYLAAAEIARDPEAFGFRLHRLEPLRFTERWVDGGVPLDAVAREVGVTVESVRELNPHLIRGMTPPGRRWPVRIPPNA